MNCWEFKKCGCEKGGVNADKKGVCPAYPNNGKNCARVAGTFCDEAEQGAFADKRERCKKCPFYNSEHYPFYLK